VKQIAWASFDSYASSILAIISVAVVGRLLTPDEIGVFSTAAVFVGMATLLRDFGVSNYLVQVKECDQLRIDTALFVTQGIATLIGLVIALVAYPVSLFYDEPRLIPTLLGLACNLLLVPRVSVTLALLRRELRFDRVVAVSFFMNLAQNGGVILFAFLDAGYMSMVYAALLSNIVGLALVLRKKNAIKMRMDRSVVRELLSFGALSSSTNILRDVRSYLNEIVLAKTQGMAMVAFQSKALSVMSLFWRSVMPGVYSFSFSYFAQGFRSSSDIKSMFLGVNQRVMGLALPVLMFLIIEGDVLILLLNGPKWGLSAEVGQIVPALFLPAFPLLALIGTLLAADGKMRELMHVQLWVIPFKLLVVLGLMYETLRVFLLGNLAVEVVVEAGLMLYFVQRLYGINLFDIYSSSLGAFVIAALFGVFAWLARHFLTEWIPQGLVRLSIEAPILIACWFLLVKLLRHPLSADADAVVSRIQERFAMRGRP